MCKVFLSECIYKGTDLKTLLNFLVAFFFVSSSAYGADQTEIIKRFVNAFNDKDVTTMLDLAAQDMKWMSVSGNTLSTDTSSHADLEKAMKSYFEAVPSAKSRLLHLNHSGNFVYALEQASWLSKGVEKSQCSMALYQLENGKIKHVWYYPAHTCP